MTSLVRSIARFPHPKEVLEEGDALPDVCRVLGPHEAPRVLELRPRRHLPIGVQLVHVARLELLQLGRRNRLLQEVVHRRTVEEGGLFD